MPAQKPGRSKQDYGTPPELIRAVTWRFGPLVVDLAASPENTVAKYYYPENLGAAIFDEPIGSLHKMVNWRGDPLGHRWLNPPFANIGSWAEKCAEQATEACPILLHVPASVGANWFRDHVVGKADLFFMNGRVTYVGQVQPYPKDTMIAQYRGREEPHTFKLWTWMEDA